MATTKGGGAKRAPKKKAITKKRVVKKKSVATKTPVAKAKAPVTLDRAKPGVAPIATSPAVKKEPAVIQRSAVVPEAATAKRSALLNRSVRSSDVTNFLRQLIMLLDAGTPILRSLKTLSARGENQGLRDLIGDIAAYVEAGNPLWQAFDRHEKYFDMVFVNLIRASEAAGNLVESLRRVVAYRQEREMLTKRVRGAMLYPVVLIVVCFLVILLLTNMVIPEFEKMFEAQGLVLPSMTKFFFGVAGIVRDFWWVLPASIVLLVAIYKLWYVKNPVRRLHADRMKLRIPVVGQIMHKNALVQFTRTMAVLMRSGLSMMQTLELTRNAIHNRAVSETLQSIRDSVEQGGGMEKPMRAAEPVIPSVVTDMFVTGEESGRVDVIADQIADVYEEEVRISVDTLGEALQPILTVIIGIVVMALFGALFGPLVSMMESISNSQ